MSVILYLNRAPVVQSQVVVLAAQNPVQALVNQVAVVQVNLVQAVVQNQVQVVV